MKKGASSPGGASRKEDAHPKVPTLAILPRKGGKLCKSSRIKFLLKETLHIIGHGLHLEMVIFCW